MHTLRLAAAGISIGLLNGLLGTGGGLIAVPLLAFLGCSGRKGHATSLAVILPLSVLSAGLYIYSARVNLIEAVSYLPGGLAGAAIGGFFLKKSSPTLLRKFFAILLIYSGVRMML